MIQNQPSGNSTSFVGKINELEKLLFTNPPTSSGNVQVVSFQKKKAIKKIKTIFRQLDQDIATTIRQMNG